MIKKLLSLNYSNSLILEMLKGAISGAIASNIVAPAISFVVLYNYVPTYILILWLAMHILVFTLRTSINKKISFNINNETYKISYLRKYIFLTSLTAFSYGIITWLGILYKAPDINIFIIGTIIISLTAGSIATLGTVYIIFFNFMIFSLLPFIVALVYHGGVIFNIFALISFIYLIIHLASGYRLFLSHKSSLDLEEKFKTIFNKSADGITIIKNNRFVECNERARDMFGYNNYSIEEFLNIHLSELMPKYQLDNKLSTKKMLQMLRKAHNEIITFQWQHKKQNNEIFWVEITLSPIRLGQEKVLHGIWRNIDDRKKAEQEIYNLNYTLESRVKEEVLKNREKDKHMLQQSRLAQMGEMISMIAHQWRQPLSAISATSISLELKAKVGKLNSDVTIKHTQKITKYSQHLSDTIDDFRDFFKPTKNKNHTSYSKLIDSVLNIVQVSIENKDITIIQDLKTDIALETYSNEIKQVILNLFKNSEEILIEKDIQNPYIKVSTYSIDNKHILEVSDNGGGIPTDIIDKVFDPYFSTKLEKNGTGLGLYMSKTIIEEHCGGQLSVSNTSEGAVFKIELFS